MFGYKGTGKSKLAQVEQKNLITDDKASAKTLNEFFVNVVFGLVINHGSNVSNDDNSKYNLDEKVSGFNLTFSFNAVGHDKISFEIKRLDSKIAFKSNGISTRIIKVIFKLKLLKLLN